MKESVGRPLIQVTRPLHQCGDGAAIGVGESGCVPILRPLTQVTHLPQQRVVLR